MTCSHCKKGECSNCINVGLILAGRNEICKCDRRGHDGEPRDQQILDPETGVVHAPGLEIHPDGEVVRTDGPRHTTTFDPPV